MHAHARYITQNTPTGNRSALTFHVLFPALAQIGRLKEATHIGRKEDKSLIVGAVGVATQAGVPFTVATQCSGRTRYRLFGGPLTRENSLHT